MGKFEMQLPLEIMRDIQRIEKDSDHIFGEMTRAGAAVAMSNLKAKLPSAITSSNMMNTLKTTVTYKTPSDDGINTKIGFYGYFINEEGKKTPAPLIANLYEYGRSNMPFPKHPFLRGAFKKGEIEQAMLAKQKELSGGLLDE